MRTPTRAAAAMPTADSSWQGCFITVRELAEADADAARELFAAGMRETIVSGMGPALLRPSPLRALAVLTVAGMHQLAVEQLLEKRGWAVSHLTAGATVAFVAFLYFVMLPRKAANNYVQKSLKADMADPLVHYVRPARNGFWVALDDSNDTVVGTVALEAADCVKVSERFQSPLPVRKHVVYM